MKQIGLKTFEEYMAVSNYAVLLEENDRLNTVVQNTKYFLDNVFKNKENILKDIDYNKNIMTNILEKDKKTVRWLKNYLSVEISSIEKWLMTKDYKTYIRIPKI
jgi:hypothetical protein